MRSVILALALLLPQMASAHVGHVAEVAGHSHWVAGAAIGLAVLVGLWGKHKDRDKDKSATRDDPEETDPEEAQA